MIRPNYADLCGSRLTHGHKFDFMTFDWGTTGAIRVSKNRKHAVKFSLLGMSLKKRMAIRRGGVQDCMRVAAVRYPPLKRGMRTAV